MLDFIPMKDNITLIQANNLDEYGIPIADLSPETLKGRVKENTERDSIPAGNGESIIYSASILLRDNVPIDYEDSLKWIDGQGVEHTSSPIKIQIKKDIANNPILTKVFL